VEPDLSIEGVWLMKGTSIPTKKLKKKNFKIRKMDLKDPADVRLLRAFWGAKESGMVNGM